MHVATPQTIIGFDAAFDECAVASGQRFDFGLRDLVHLTLGRRRSHAKRDGEDATRFEQSHQFSKRSRPIRRRDVLPDAGQQDQVEGKTRVMGNAKRRQAIIKPPNARIRMPHRPFAQH